MIDVMIAHRSHEVRSRLASKISRIGGINVSSRVRNPSEFFEKVEKTEPDVIMLGIRYDGVSGLDLIDRLMATEPTPVLVIEEEENQETVKSFSYGAIDFVSAEEPVEDIKGLVELASNVTQFSWSSIDEEVPEPPFDTGKAIVVGASTGGPGSVETIISNLPEDLPAPVFIAQHMSEGYIRKFAERLDNLGCLDVKEAENEEEAEKGTVYIGPAKKDFFVEEEGQEVSIRTEDSGDGETPSIDRLFTSVYEVYGGDAITVVLSGMGNDGVVGARYLSSAGSTLIVQDEKTSAVYGIGNHVVDQGDADKILPIDQIPGAIVRCL